MAGGLAPVPPGPHSGSLFCCAQSSQPPTFKIIIAGFLKGQWLEHQHGFQYEIAAAPVVFFFALQFTISQAGITARPLTNARF